MRRQDGSGNVHSGAARRDARTDPLVHATNHVPAPTCRSAGDVEQPHIQLRIRGTKRRQQFVPHTVPQKGERHVGRVFDPLEPASARIPEHVLPGALQQRTTYVARSEQAGNSARSGAAQNAHQHRFDLVIDGVRGRDPGRARLGGRSQEPPPRVAEGSFAAKRAGCSGADAVDAEHGGPVANQRRGLAGDRSGTVVERGDRQPIAAHDASGGIEQRDRVHAAGNGEHDRIVAIKRFGDALFNAGDDRSAH